MSRDTIKARVRRLVEDHLGVGSDKTESDKAKLQDDLGADSLDTVELVMAFEEEFGIEITDEEGEGCESLGDIYSLLERKGVNI